MPADSEQMVRAKALAQKIERTANEIVDVAALKFDLMEWPQELRAMVLHQVARRATHLAIEAERTVRAARRNR